VTDTFYLQTEEKSKTHQRTLKKFKKNQIKKESTNTSGRTELCNFVGFLEGGVGRSRTLFSWCGCIERVYMAMACVLGVAGRVRLEA